MKTQQINHEESGCTDYLQHPWESCPQNPHLNKTWSDAHCNDFGKSNKAQHSPLPPYVTAETLYQAEKARDTHKLHADKLAEALKKVKYADDHGLNLTDSINGALAALAAYEAAQ